MCSNQTGDIFHSSSLKLVDKFTYLGSSVSSTETDIDTRLSKAWTANNRLSVRWKSDRADKMKPSFFQAAIVSILLYGCTTWKQTKRMEEKLDGNYTRLPRTILNRSWRQHPTKQQLYGHLPPITKTIQARRTRHAEHYWRSRDELISDILLWTPSHGRAKAGWPARTNIQQLCEDTECSPEDLPEAMNDRERWQERGKGYLCRWHDKMMMMSIFLSSFLAQCKKNPEYLKRGKAQVFIPAIRLLLYNLISKWFLILLSYPILTFFFVSVGLIMSASASLVW